LATSRYVAVVSKGEKKVSSLGGHRLAPTSPHYARRLELMPERNDRVQEAILTRDIEKLGVVTEEDAVDLHVMAMTSNPPVYYWNEGSVRLMREVREWRGEGVPCYFTFDAGPNAHIICEKGYEEEVVQRVKSLEVASSVLVNEPGEGSRVTLDHLFLIHS